MIPCRAPFLAGIAGKQRGEGRRGVYGALVDHNITGNGSMCAVDVNLVVYSWPRALHVRISSW